MLVFDYECWNCGHFFEEFVKTLEDKVPCESCGASPAHRMPSAPILRYLEMGVDPTMTTSADKWADMREQKIRMENSKIGED